VYGFYIIYIYIVFHNSLTDAFLKHINIQLVLNEKPDDLTIHREFVLIHVRYTSCDDWIFGSYNNSYDVVIYRYYKMERFYVSSLV